MFKNFKKTCEENMMYTKMSNKYNYIRKLG